jgi:hypothetical protein
MIHHLRPLYTRPLLYLTPVQYSAFEFELCSADGTLSVMDVRSKKTKPTAQSEDQEDELLSIIAIKG